MFYPALVEKALVLKHQKLLLLRKTTYTTIMKNWGILMRLTENYMVALLEAIGENKAP